MDRRRNRGTARHDGVVLLARTLQSGATSWRARFFDPDERKIRYETLPAARSGTEDLRAAWAVEKARSLDRRGVELDEGAVKKKNTGVEKAFDNYFSTMVPDLRERTVRDYKKTRDVVVMWAHESGIENTDDITRSRLVELRGWIADRPHLRQVRGKRRGRGHEATAKKRKSTTVNRDLRQIRAMMENLRDAGYLPMLKQADDVAKGLKLLKEDDPLPVFLKPTELMKLVEAGRKHDEETFKLTRDEKDRGLTQGASPRYKGILPFLTTVLLSGMRFDEARTLKWSTVDLETPPEGVIVLRPEDVKTHRGRLVDLVVSPLLGTLLTSMKLRAGDAVFVFQGDEDGEPAPVSRDVLEAARKRLKRIHGAPKFTWQGLRATCESYLVNAPGIFGAATVYKAAVQLGHDVSVAQEHYLTATYVDREAKTLEAAMGIEKELRTALGLGASVVKQPLSKKA